MIALKILLAPGLTNRRQVCGLKAITLELFESRFRGHCTAVQKWGFLVLPCNTL